MFFDEPETDRVLRESLREILDSETCIIEVARNINDPACAQRVVQALQGLQA